MSNEDATGLIVAGLTITVVLIAATIAWAMGKAGRSSAEALWVGGIAPPTVLVLIFVASLAADREVDGPPPGMVVGGLLICWLVLVPLCLVSSGIGIWILRKSCRG